MDTKDSAPAGGDEPAIEVWPEWVRIAVNRANDAGREAGRAEAVSAPAGSGEVSDAIQFLRDCAANSGGFHITSERCRRAREILSLLSGEEPIRELLESCWLAIDSIQGGGSAKAELLRRIDAALLRKLSPAGSGEVEDTLLARLDGRAAYFENVSRDPKSAGLFRESAALLRKLQQGADYVMVPREPTEAMRAAFTAESMPGFAAMTTIRIGDFGERYRYMIAASQGQEGGTNG